jgi:hypothetical protein
MHAQALHPAHLVEHVRAWPRRVFVTIAAIVVVLIGVRVALPYVIANQINKRLEDIPGYRGQVDEVHLNLFRGAYTLVGISIYRVNSGREDPFFLARTIDFSIAWRELFHGKVVSDIFIDRGALTIIRDRRRRPVRRTPIADGSPSSRISSQSISSTWKSPRA